MVAVVLVLLAACKVGFDERLLPQKIIPTFSAKEFSIKENDWQAARAGGDKAAMIKGTLELQKLLNQSGKYSEAARLISDCLEQVNGQGDWLVLQEELADTFRDWGRYEEARKIYLKGLSAAKDQGNGSGDLCRLAIKLSALDYLAASDEQAQPAVRVALIRRARGRLDFARAKLKAPADSAMLVETLNLNDMLKALKEKSQGSKPNKLP